MLWSYDKLLSRGHDAYFKGAWCYEGVPFVESEKKKFRATIIQYPFVVWSQGQMWIFTMLQMAFFVGSRKRKFWRPMLRWYCIVRSKGKIYKIPILQQPLCHRVVRKTKWIYDVTRSWLLQDRKGKRKHSRWYDSLCHMVAEGKGQGPNASTECLSYDRKEEMKGPWCYGSLSIVRSWSEVETGSMPWHLLCRMVIKVESKGFDATMVVHRKIIGTNGLVQVEWAVKSWSLLIGQSRWICARSVSMWTRVSVGARKGLDQTE